MKKKMNLLLALTIIAVLFFGAFFAYNVRGYISDRRELQEAAELTEEITDIFRSWLENAFPTAPPIAEYISGEAPTTEEYPAESPSDAPPRVPGILTPTPDAIPDILPYDEIPYIPPPCFFTLLEAIRVETRNRDIVAFINIPGTNIQYAVVQSDCNVFYLSHNLRRRSNLSGSIFMDYRNNPDFSDPNTILYGHHLRDSTKFTQLREFRSRSFFNENRYIQIFTDDSLIEYEIVAAFTTMIDFWYIQVHFEEGEFITLANEMLRRSYVNARIPVTEEDRLLVLSTCSMRDDDERIVVVGRRLCRPEDTN